MVRYSSYVSIRKDQTKLNRILGYLDHTPNQNLIQKVGNTIGLREYIDSSYGTYDDVNPVTGTVILLGDAPVYFKSSEQKILTCGARWHI